LITLHVISSVENVPIYEDSACVTDNEGNTECKLAFNLRSPADGTRTGTAPSVISLNNPIGASETGAVVDRVIECKLSVTALDLSDAASVDVVTGGSIERAKEDLIS
jgi:hypothetical protein